LDTESERTILVDE